MSPATATQLAPILDQARDRLVYALAGSVVEQYSLDADDEAALTRQVQGIVFDVLTVADSLAAKLAELQALRERAIRHADGHIGCRRPGCPVLGSIEHRIRHLEGRSAVEAQRLRGGH